MPASNILSHNAFHVRAYKTIVLSYKSLILDLKEQMTHSTQEKWLA